MAVSEAIKLSKNLSYGTIWLIWAGAKLGINSNQLKLLTFPQIEADRQVCVELTTSLPLPMT